MIRDATERDVPTLVSIQSTALPETILSRLGERFLEEVAFPAMLAADGFTLVHTHEDRVDAFVVFSRDSQALTAELSRRRALLAWHAVRAVVRAPAFIGDIVGFVRQHRLELTPGVDISGLPELYAIATAPSRQSNGIGSQLVRCGLQRLAEGGQSRCLVKAASARAGQFYQRLGFDAIGFESRGRTRLQVLVSPPASEAP